MEKLYELHEETDFDLVVVDTPPTRNALDFLDAPRRLTRFLDHRLYRILMAPTRGLDEGGQRGGAGVPAHGVEGGRRRRDRRRHRVLPGVRRHGGGLPAPSRQRARAARVAEDRVRARRVAAPRHRRGGGLLRPPAARGGHRRAGADRQPHAPASSATARPRRRASGPARSTAPISAGSTPTSPTSAWSRPARRSTSPAWPNASPRAGRAGAVPRSDVHDLDGLAEVGEYLFASSPRPPSHGRPSA